ncbi:MAG TPA: hypothetical protein VG936_04330 [Lacunisphaera sp.]|nr:hypothetical protein [Lacunisphaera sp.]
MSKDIAAATKVRDRAIRLSIGTSLFSKIGTLFLQVAALPMAAKTLGVAGFAVYTLCSGSLSLLSFADLGVGPMMVRRIAIGEAIRDGKMVQNAVYGGMLTSLLAMILLLGLGAAALGGALPGFGKGSVAVMSQGAFAAALFAAMIVCVAQLSATFASRLLAGYQRIYLGNMASGIGVVLSATATIVTCLSNKVEPWMVILSVYLPTAICQTTAGLWIGLNKRVLLSAWRLGDRREVYAMIIEGFGFAVFGGLVPFLEREGTKWFAAGTGSALALAKIGLAFQIIGILGGGVTIFTVPLVPAIADARARMDIPWLRKRFKQVRTAVGSLGMVIIFAAPIFGPDLIRAAFGKGFSFTRLEAICIACSFSLFAWVSLHWTLLSSTGIIWKPAAVGLCEALVALILIKQLWPYMAEASVFVALPIVIALMSGWVFPLLCRKVLSSDVR